MTAHQHPNTFGDLSNADPWTSVGCVRASWGDVPKNASFWASLRAPNMEYLEVDTEIFTLDKHPQVICMHTRI